MDMPFKYYMYSVIKPCGIVFILAVLIVLGLHYSLHLHTVPMTLLLLLTTGTVIISIGLNKNERLALKKAIVTEFAKYNS